MAVISIKDMPRYEATEKFFQMAALDPGGRDDELSLKEVITSLSASKMGDQQERTKELYETVQFLMAPSEVEVYQDGKKTTAYVSKETAIEVYSKNPDVSLSRLKSLARYRVQQNVSNSLFETRMFEAESSALSHGMMRYGFVPVIAVCLGAVGGIIVTGGTVLYSVQVAAFVFGVGSGLATLDEQVGDINKKAAEKALGKQP